MGIKIIGSFLIIFTSVAISYFYDKNQKDKQQALQEICDFIEYIKLQIKLFVIPLEKIYEQYESKSQHICALISDGCVKGFSEKIDKELNKCFKSLGKGYKDEQIKNLECAYIETKEELEKLKKEYSQKTKVFRAMAIFIGCSIVILLV